MIGRSVQTTRSSATVALVIEGFFAAAWFGWGSDGAPHWLAVPLVVGTVAGVVLGVTGIILGRRSRPDPGPNPMRHRTYLVTVAVEVVAAAAGALVLAGTGRGEYIAAWVALVVGVHFFPLGRLFGRTSLYLLGAAVCLVAVVAIVLGAADDANPRIFAGVGVGVALLVSALVIAVRVLPGGPERIRA